MDGGCSDIFLPRQLADALGCHSFVYNPSLIEIATGKFTTSWGQCLLGDKQVTIAEMNPLVSEPFLTSNYPIAFVKEGDRLQMIDLSRVILDPHNSVIFDLHGLSNGLSVITCDHLITLKDWRAHPDYDGMSNPSSILINSSLLPPLAPPTHSAFFSAFTPTVNPISNNPLNYAFQPHLVTEIVAPWAEGSRSSKHHYDDSYFQNLEKILMRTQDIDVGSLHSIPPPPFCPILPANADSRDLPDQAPRHTFAQRRTQPKQYGPSSAQLTDPSYVHPVTAITGGRSTQPFHRARAFLETPWLIFHSWSHGQLETLQRMSTHGAVHGLGFTTKQINNSVETDCWHCLQAKMQRLPILKNPVAKMIYAIGQCWYYDQYPNKMRSIEGFVHTLYRSCQQSSFEEVMGQRSTSQTTSQVLHMLTDRSFPRQCKVLAIVFDHANVNLCKAIFSIIDTMKPEDRPRLYPSAPYDQVHNPAESRIKQHKGLQRTLMLQNNSYGCFCFLASKQACRIRNRLLRPGATIVPEEMMTGIKPDISFDRPFGVDGMAYDSPAQRKQRKSTDHGRVVKYLGHYEVSNPATGISYSSAADHQYLVYDVLLMKVMPRANCIFPFRLNGASPLHVIPEWRSEAGYRAANPSIDPTSVFHTEEEEHILQSADPCTELADPAVVPDSHSQSSPSIDRELDISAVVLADQAIHSNTPVATRTRSHAHFAHRFACLASNNVQSPTLLSLFSSSSYASDIPAAPIDPSYVDHPLCFPRHYMTTIDDLDDNDDDYYQLHNDETPLKTSFSAFEAIIEVMDWTENDVYQDQLTDFNGNSIFNPYVPFQASRATDWHINSIDEDQLFEVSPSSIFEPPIPDQIKWVTPDWVLYEQPLVPSYFFDNGDGRLLCHDGPIPNFISNDLFSPMNKKLRKTLVDSVPSLPNVPEFISASSLTTDWTFYKPAEDRYRNAFNEQFRDPLLEPLNPKEKIQSNIHQQQLLRVGKQSPSPPSSYHDLLQSNLKRARHEEDKPSAPTDQLNQPLPSRPIPPTMTDYPCPRNIAEAINEKNPEHLIWRSS